MDWPDAVKDGLILRASVPPSSFGLPKIHKQDCPLRPIVNTIKSPTYFISKYLAGLLKPCVGKTEAYVKNSSALVPALESLVWAPLALFVSLDVVSLYTNVPVQQTLDWLRPFFPGAVINLFRCVLSSTCCMFNGMFFEQARGVAMGFPLSSIFADFFIE